MDERDGSVEPGAPSSSKRSLLKAVWVAPVILSVTLPRAAMAQAISTPSPLPAPPPPASPPPGPP
jgi:hypothetical protein